MRTTLTVFFESPFYIGLFERWEDGCLQAARVVFGAEPTDAQVLAWVLDHYAALRFSPPVAGGTERPLADNPKRRQRQAGKAAQRMGGTKAQQALQAAREENAETRKNAEKARREEAEARKRTLKEEKRKAKHKGR